MKLTKQEIESKLTAKGGYTKSQLAEWGIAWPPPQGWKQRLIEGDVTAAKERLNSYQKHRIHQTKDYTDTDCYLCQKAIKERVVSFWGDDE